MVNATPSTVANGNDIQRKKNGYFDMPILPANVYVVPLAVFRGGNGHHRDSMEKDRGSQRFDLPIGLIVIVLRQYNNYHIKFRIL